MIDPKSRRTRLLIAEEAISKASGVTIADIRGRDRQREFAEARFAVWYIAYEYLGYSYPQIANLYERDHSTIMSGVKKIRESSMAKTIDDGIRKTYPELIAKTPDNEPRTIEEWKF